MKLVYPEWEKALTWEGGRFPLVVLENRRCHFRTVQALSEAVSGGDSRFVLSEGEQILDMAKKAAFLPSPWSMDFNSRALMTAFYSRVKQELRDEARCGMAQETAASVARLAEDIDEALPFAVTYDAEPDMTALLKTLHLRPEAAEGALPERMLAYMELSTELLGTACFLFCGFRGFLEREELRGLYHTAFLKKFHLVLIENYCPDIVEEEDRFIIDEDFCQIF